MRFIAFEGLDGSGKSTLCARLAEALALRGIPPKLTREPGGTALGDALRRLILAEGTEVPSPRAEALLYQAGRAQHVAQLIKPALARGEWVLTDRFAASSVAFQAGGRVLNEDDVRWLNHFATGGLTPDLNVLLDVTVRESERRRAGRGGEDRFEREATEFHERVRAAYLALAAADPSRWLVLDGAESPERLCERVVNELGARRWLD